MAENSSAVLRMRAVPIRLYEVTPGENPEIVERDGKPIVVEVGIVMTANTLAAIEERFSKPVKKMFMVDVTQPDGTSRVEPLVVDGTAVTYEVTGIEAWQAALDTYRGILTTLSIVLAPPLGRNEIECGLAMIPEETKLYGQAFLAAYAIANGMDPDEGKALLEAKRQEEKIRLQELSVSAKEQLAAIAAEFSVPAVPSDRPSSEPSDIRGMSGTGSGAVQDSPTTSSGLSPRT